MKEVITYSLSEDNEDANGYYEDITSFTDKVILKISSDVSIWIDDFSNFIKEKDIESLRSELEYALELLTLGVLWITYIGKSNTLKKVPRNILIKLSDLRDKNNLKKPVDFLRGVFETLFLSKENSKSIDFTLDNLKKLMNWLSSTGEFKEEGIRLTAWIDYLSTKSNSEVQDLISTSINSAKWFQKISKDEIGRYTEHVNDFLEKTYKSYRWREDIISCRRRRVEYHLNMVGAEILNRCYREDFLKTKEKRLLLPVCMRLNFNKCKATKTEDGYICVNCTKSCAVSKYTYLGEKYNFKVYIIPHGSSKFKTEKDEDKIIGIIGVACILNLISGGWKAKRLGLIPQCVLLNYCGCKSHWHKSGIVTSIDTKRLLYTFGIENN